MINSMTGFGRFESLDEAYKLSVEIKAVNHRYLDINMKLPKKLNQFDSKIRQLVKTKIGRGKLDLYCYYEDLSKGAVTIAYNKNLATEYMQRLGQMATDFNIDNDIRVSNLSRYPEILVPEEACSSSDELWGNIEAAVSAACDQLNESRHTEGIQLREDLLKKLELMSTYVDFIEDHMPQIIEEYRGKINKRVQDLLGDTKVDESRIATEVTIFADKICVDEETVRLQSHIATTKQLLIQGGPIGRKLDFIAQEMNREANTILSKSTNIEISNIGIDLKTCIEKVREQIQNIE